MPREDDKLIAKIILKNHLATEEEVKDCLREVETRRQARQPARLIDVLLSRGIIDKREAKALLVAYEQTLQVRALNKRIPGYQFTRVLGYGTAGTVFLGTQLNIGREVAIKVLKEDLARNPGFIRNFRREAKSAARLNHPNVIQAIDVGESDGIQFFVMEFVDGETLQGVMKRERRIDEGRVIDIAIQMASALEHASRYGMIHRDIKPANILINTEGRAKLCDMGLARPTDAGTSTSIDGRLAGTPAYMSPEQAMGKKDLDGRADIFSLGSTMYHAVTGRIPFSAKNLPDLLSQLVRCEFEPPRKVQPAVSEAVEEVIMRMMAREKVKRPESPGQVKEMLKNVRAEIPAGPPLRIVTPDGPRIIPPTDNPHSRSFNAPSLVVVSGADKGKTFLLSLAKTTVGRHSSADIRLKDQWISRHHFRILISGEKAEVEALSERNRTMVNGQPVRRATLSPGDEISIFTTTLRYVLKPVAM